MFLLVNSVAKQCGMYQYGFRFYRILKDGGVTFDYVEVDAADQYVAAIKGYDAIVHNFLLFPWLSSCLDPTSRNYFIYHEGWAANGVQDWQIINADPTKPNGIPRPLYFPKVIPTPRAPNLECPTIGSFGLGLYNKHFDRIVRVVQDEFDNAIIRFRMPFAFYVDPDGVEAKHVVKMCFDSLHKPGIKLSVCHDFGSDEDIATFLGENDLNMFLYRDVDENRGCASATDFALSAGRPFAISSSTMFRHVFDESICVDTSSLKSIMCQGIAKHSDKLQRWSHVNLIDSFSFKVILRT